MKTELPVANGVTAKRPGWSHPVIDRLTVRELREVIGGLDDDTPVVLTDMAERYEYRAEEAYLPREGVLVLRIVKHPLLPE